MAKKKKKATKKRRPLQLKVIFDTNILYTQTASDLVSAAMRDLVKGNSSHSDLSIKWFLPSVVIDERRYQMQNKAIELLPNLQKIEKLIGHKLNITEDILIQRVNEAVQAKLKELNLVELLVDTTSVDWKELIRRSSFRETPFETSKNEKGFRDSIITESLFQLIKASPTTPSICCLAIVTNDNLLSEFVREKTSDAKNIRIIPSLQELESLINTLVSTVTEEFVAEIKDKAKAYFFEPEKLDTLFYKERIGNRIIKQYSTELNYCPTEGRTKERGQFWIYPPVFLKKERQRVYWTTPIAVDYKLYKYEVQKSISPKPPPPPSALAGYFHGLPSPPSTFLTGFSPPPPPLNKVDAGKGQTLFEVSWSINMTQNNNLTSPKIIDIKFVEHRPEK